MVRGIGEVLILAGYVGYVTVSDNIKQLFRRKNTKNNNTPSRIMSVVPYPNKGPTLETDIININNVIIENQHDIKLSDDDLNSVLTELDKICNPFITGICIHNDIEALAIINIITNKRPRCYLCIKVDTQLTGLHSKSANKYSD